jgi:hypothetical protein
MAVHKRQEKQNRRAQFLALQARSKKGGWLLPRSVRDRNATGRMTRSRPSGTEEG